jgi:hypothetical protein
MNKIKCIAAVLIGIAGLSLQQAKADKISIGAPNSALVGYPSPYANASITLAGDGLSATVSFTSVNTGTYIYFMGDGGSVALNVNGSFTVSGLSASNSFAGFNPPAPVNGGAGNEDGFGSFNLTLNTGDGYFTSATTVNFTVLNTSGTAWTGVTSGLNAMLTENNRGFIAAAHIFVGGNPPDAHAQALATGFAGNGDTGTPVPDGGATVMLLGAALGVLGMARRFLRS